jgi:hypothetical protein
VGLDPGTIYRAEAARPGRYNSRLSERHGKEKDLCAIFDLSCLVQLDPEFPLAAMCDPLIHRSQHLVNGVQSAPGTARKRGANVCGRMDVISMQTDDTEGGLYLPEQCCCPK